MTGTVRVSAAFEYEPLGTPDMPPSSFDETGADGAAPPRAEESVLEEQTATDGYLIEEVQAFNATRKEPVDDIERIFLRFDDDNSGTIDRDELTKARATRAVHRSCHRKRRSLLTTSTAAASSFHTTTDARRPAP